MSLDSFPNAKPKLLGEGEDSIGIIVTPAVAGLTGDATLAESTTAANNVIKLGFTTTINGELAGTAPNTKLSQAVTTPADSLVVVAACAYYMNDGGNTQTINIRVLDGAVILKSASRTIPANGENILSVLFVGIPLTGSRTYNVQAWITPSSRLLAAVRIDISHVKLTDTHAGFIQTVAVAGKQINTPDSHTTHEQGEIPA